MSLLNLSPFSQPVSAVPLSPLSSDDGHSDLISSIHQRLDAIENRLHEAADTNKINMLVMDNSQDRLLAAFMVATSAASCGMEVSMFFSFWATAALRKNRKQVGSKSLVERAFGWMLPSGLRATKLSQLHMFGLGKLLLQSEMKQKNIADLERLLQTAGELGVQISVCEMSMRLMGITREELIAYPGLTYCGATTFVDASTRSNTTLVF